MFKHHLLLIYRNVLRYKSSFFINLIGLSTGLACVLLIYLWVRDELQVDKFHETDSQLYQVMARSENANGIEVAAELPPVLAQTLEDEFPEVEYAVSEGMIPSTIALGIDDKVFNVIGMYASKAYFKAFSYKLFEGDKNQVLAGDNNIVISDKLAIKLYNTTENVVGKSVTFGRDEQFLITGIYSIPQNSSREFEFVLPISVLFKHNPNVKNDWSNSWPSAYVLLKEGTDLVAFNDKIEDLLNRKSNQEHTTLFATLYTDVYLYGKYENGVQAGGRIEYVRLFSIIAVFILLIACINFMNLSTAKASIRIKEVGIKKVIGAQRETLIFQYLGESLLMVFLSLTLAIILMVIFLPQFNALTGKQLFFNLERNFILAVTAVALFTSLTAGSYPAFYLSGFNPAKVLKGGAEAGKVGHGVSVLWARKGLVVFQFALSVVFISAVLVVYKQIEFIQNKNLGFNKDNIVYFEMQENVKDRMETFLSEVNSLPGVLNASSIFRTFLGSQNSTADLSWQGKASNSKTEMEYRRVNYDMLELLGINVKEGRAFSRNFSTDISKIIFNEAAVKTMGLEEPIGKRIKLWGEEYEILGVVEDFHFESLHENVKPLFFYLAPERTNTVMVKVDSEKINETIAALKEQYSAFNGGQPLEYKFLDATYQAQYEAEQRVSMLSRYFAGLAILISCLGLFGLAAFTAQRRRREISIRKIHGSSNLNIVFLLSADFTKLVLVAILIATPVSYLLVSNWLNGFAYSVELELWYFIVAGLIALGVTWLTVGVQAFKAAHVNPTQHLKDA